jgi:type IV secretory pathway TraG/TraD family ATPase VirD4
MTQNAKRTSRLGTACYVFTAFFMGLWAATQFVAWRVAYHPSVGPNLHGVYPPWDILVWWRQGGYDAFPDLFWAGGSAGTGITAVMLIFFHYYIQLLQTQVELWKRYTVQHVGRAENTLKKLDFLKMKVCSSEAGKIRKQERVIIFVLRETFIFWPLLPRAQEKGFALFYPLC